jgi:hypothetical protein
MAQQPDYIRAAKSRAALENGGGRIVQVRLRKDEVVALAKLRHAGDYATDADAIRAAIIDAAKKSKKGA